MAKTVWDVFTVRDGDTGTSCGARRIGRVMAVDAIHAKAKAFMRWPRDLRFGVYVQRRA